MLTPPFGRRKQPLRSVPKFQHRASRHAPCPARSDWSVARRKVPAPGITPSSPAPRVLIGPYRVPKFQHPASRHVACPARSDWFALHWRLRNRYANHYPRVKVTGVCHSFSCCRPIRGRKKGLKSQLKRTEKKVTGFFTYFVIILDISRYIYEITNTR